jgi:MgtC family
VSFPPFSADTLDILLRLVAAALVGMVIGLNRDFKGKPSGMRTLSLLSLGAALVSVTAVHYPGMAGHADALSRVLQGIIQGIMAGVGLRLPVSRSSLHASAAGTLIGEGPEGRHSGSPALRRPSA